MIKQVFRIPFFAFALLVSAGARAELMPDGALQKDYDNCMGKDTADKAPEHAQYCECIRDGMRSWTVDEYGATATEAKNAQQTPDKIGELAKTCLAKALH